MAQRFVIYRSSDYAWNDHPNKTTNGTNQPIRAPSPIKTKLSTSARHLANGVLHEGTANSMLHLPISSSPPIGITQSTIKDDIHLSSATKIRHTTRLQRTNSHLDKTPGTNNYGGLPIRSESYRSSRLDYGLRTRNTSSKQRSYANSKSTFHDINSGDYSNQEENTYHHPQQSLNLLSSTQRLNGSSYDLTTSRKTLSPNKSNTFNITAHYNSTQELHRNGTTIDRNNATRFPLSSKDQLLTSTIKHRQTSIIPVNGTQTTISNPSVAATSAIVPPPVGERHPSAQSYKSRDPNISYAYTDVKKYIEENDLMSPEKEQIIRNWILDVEKYRHQLQKIE